MINLTKIQMGAIAVAFTVLLAIGGGALLYKQKQNATAAAAAAASAKATAEKEEQGKKQGIGDKLKKAFGIKTSK
jgi:hypothetical protein